MAEHALYGKKKLCYTEVIDFTDFQGIGQDPLYKRYDSVYSVISKNIPEEYRDFLAQPVYSDIDDQISWYSREWNEDPEKFSDLPQDSQESYLSIKDKTLKVYKDTLTSLKGEDFMILNSALTHIDNDFLFCYDGKVTVVAWGMTPDTSRHVVLGTIIHGFDFHRKRRILFDEGLHGTFPTKIDGKMTRADGTVLTERDIPSLRVKEGYIFKCWEPDPVGFKITGDAVFTAKYEKIEEPATSEDEETVTVHFKTGNQGFFSGEENVVVKKGSCLRPDDIPIVSAVSGYRFVGWDRPTSSPIDNDTTFTAVFEREDVNCFFNAGEFGTLSGDSRFTLPLGSYIPSSSIPQVTPKQGYRFTGWDLSPYSTILNKDTTFTAQYEKEERIPWWKKLWMFIIGKGCLKWLLWLLLLLLLVFLLSCLFRSCEGGVFHEGRIIPGIGGGNYIDPVEEVITDDGRTIDDNGSTHNIIGDDGRLPDGNVIAPVVGDDGTTPPIIQNPGAPDIIANRLNIYFEGSDVDLNAFAADFKNIYPSNDYEIIGVDYNVKMIQIKIPESRRDFVRDNLNSQLPDYKFFVVDESLLTLGGFSTSSTEDVGWHLKAINLKEGWAITKGRNDVVVAVVDDGIDPRHDILKGKIVSAYNVFTQDNRLSIGGGHGTHVAGLAVGSDKYFNRGVSGVAPKCKLMPVQVFDNGLCTFSSLTSGVMYAIHNNADVINISVGPKFSGLDVLPEDMQRAIAENQFKNEERVWRKIISIANEKNAIIVFAVGNENILSSIPPECRTSSALNVAAVDKQFKETAFTNYGAGSNISAPGESICSSIPDNAYAVLDGTSMAAPIISGTVALLKSVNKDISISEVIPILQQSGRGVTGNVPPMVQVDRALLMQRDGNVASVNEMSSDGILNSEDSAQQTDYDELRRMIEFYKQKIRELESQLPENNGR